MPPRERSEPARPCSPIVTCSFFSLSAVFGTAAPVKGLAHYPVCVCASLWERGGTRVAPCDRLRGRTTSATSTTSCTRFRGSVVAFPLRRVGAKNRSTPVFRSAVSRARYFNPGTGRFWTMDTFEGDQEDPLSLHKYLFCHGNPGNLVDPGGHAVYFVTRKFADSTGFVYRAANFGHGYLLFTVPADPGKGEPLKSGWPALTTFSWHPSDFTYMNGHGYDARLVTPGRVWERHPDDMNPSSYKPFCVTTDPMLQQALLTGIHNWIDSQPVGFDKGPPIKVIGSGNRIGSTKHRPPPDDPIYYSVSGQNCVWWSTIMLMQNGFNPLPAKVSKAILNYNAGFGDATEVINDPGKYLNKAYKMSDNLFNMYVPSDDVDVADAF